MPSPCSFGCTYDRNTTMHRFPNPDKYPERFATWVHLVGGKLETPADYVKYRNKFNCDVHFAVHHRNRFNRLNALAIPTLHLQVRNTATLPLLLDQDRAIDDNNRNDSHADGDSHHSNTTTDTQEPFPLFSWQETNFISLDDEQQTETEDLVNTEFATVRTVNYNSEIVNDKTPSEFIEYQCDACQNNITGYTCVQCDDYDLCRACDATLIHPQHYMLRVSGVQPQREVKLIVEVIKRKLKILEAEQRDGDDSIARKDCHVDIKKEDPFEEMNTKTAQHCMKDKILEAISDHCKVPDVTSQVDKFDKTCIERNRVHDSESELLDNSEPVDDIQKEDNVEFLDIADDVDSGCNRYKTSTLRGLLDYKKENTCKDLKLKESLRKRSHKIMGKNKCGEDSVLFNPKKKDTIFKVSNVPKVKSSIETKNHRATNRRSGYINTCGTLLSCSSNKILQYPSKRKANDHSDDVDETKLDRLTNVAGISKTTEITTKYTGINVTGNRIKLSDFDTGQLKKSTILVGLDDRQTVLPKDNVNLRRPVVRLEDISKNISYIT